MQWLEFLMDPKYPLSPDKCCVPIKVMDKILLHTLSYTSLTPQSNSTYA